MASADLCDQLWLTDGLGTFHMWSAAWTPHLMAETIQVPKTQPTSRPNYVLVRTKKHLKPSEPNLVPKQNGPKQNPKHFRAFSRKAL